MKVFDTVMFLIRSSLSASRRNCSQMVTDKLDVIREALLPEMRMCLDDYLKCILPLPDADFNVGCLTHFADSELQKKCSKFLVGMENQQ